MNCYVLTGGLSRRMGSPKPSMVLGDRTFFQRVTSAAGGVFDHVYEVTRAGRPPSGAVASLQEPPHEETSPMFGLLAALRHAAAPVWILATDYPLVTAGLLLYLRGRFEDSNSEILVPVWDGEPQLLCAGYRPAVAPDLDRRIGRRWFRLRDLVESREVEYVEESEVRARFDGELLANVNEREEYERIRRSDGG